jgi:RNA polymerase sigma factor (sigma-70 family)
MRVDKPSAELLAEWTRGGQSAADELFRRYIGRLTALARGKISRRLGRRLDAEDVALSAYRSFFVRARTGQISLAHSGDLWRLLVGIALNKLHRQVLHHRAGKRSIDREQPPAPGVDEGFAPEPFVDRQPTAAEAAVVAEEFERFLSGLTSTERRILELRLRDHSQREIAALLGRSERTVRRVLSDLQRGLERRLLEPEAVTGERRPYQREAVDDIDLEPPDDGLSVAALNAAGMIRPMKLPAAASTADWLSDADFQLARHLGSGGSGKVYQAWWRSAGQWVAVKVLKKRSQTDPEAVERFLREASTLARLRHPGIVPIRGIGRLRSGGYFLVLDLVAGDDLSFVMNERKIETNDALRWVAEAAMAVEHAHQHGVIHCDLKPSNLLLDADGRIRVTDFGFAHVLGIRGNHPLPAGTLGFMAPEQIDPVWGAVGPRTDVFGFGAVLFALLTGKPPFVAETWKVSVARLLSGPTPTLRSALPEIPAPVDGICRRCLSRNPEERFASAGELARAIGELI